MPWQKIFNDSDPTTVIGCSFQEKQGFSMTRRNMFQRNLSDRRRAGVLQHITCLPSCFGIGDLGPEAYRFADFLSEARMEYWQVLPLTQVNYRYDCSPYNCMSAFGGNKYLISPEMMARSGYLTDRDLRDIPSFAKTRVDYPRVIRYKDRLFAKAHERFCSGGGRRKAYLDFCRKNDYWLSDFAIFLALKRHMADRTWAEWPRRFKYRESSALRTFVGEFPKYIDSEKFLQFVFHEQWRQLKAYCTKSGIQIIGDMPIYVDFESVDVWSHPGLFRLGEGMRPLFVSGVPPDYFSDTGQLWGNPVYDWGAIRKTGYRWWVERLAYGFRLFDYVRLDHFRGFVAYWQVPSRAKTAKNGRWIEAPAWDFLKTLSRRFPILPLIAEDLGTITPDVREVMREFGLPGMKILLFAFGDGGATNPYLPHNHTQNCVVYTGTHDNNTVRGWFENEASASEKQKLSAYVGKTVNPRRVHEEFIRLAMTSVANTAIIPIQDILGLGESARMNRPASTKGNWRWRMPARYLKSGLAKRLHLINITYGRV